MCSFFRFQSLQKLYVLILEHRKQLFFVLAVRGAFLSAEMEDRKPHKRCQVSKTKLIQVACNLVPNLIQTCSQCVQLFPICPFPSSLFKRHSSSAYHSQRHVQPLNSSFNYNCTKVPQSCTYETLTLIPVGTRSPI